VNRLLTEQLEDGGWNCEAENGSVRSSFATTINVLEGLLAHERATGGSAESIAARRRGEKYLLERNLFRRRSTGEIVDPPGCNSHFPPAGTTTCCVPSSIFALPAIQRTYGWAKQSTGPLQTTTDGTWLLEKTHPGKVHFALEEDGRSSRWNTLRALRVLRWYEGSTC
jgi:hypothetical protein